MGKTAAGNPAITFDRIQAQATDTVQRDARRVRELAERFRSAYRERLEEWVRMRAGLNGHKPTSRTAAAAAERLRARHEQEGRELASLQGRLKRLDVAARQLELVASYLASPDPAVDEPTLDTDQSHAALPLRIIQAQEGERQRLAEGVHDGPAQVLTNAIFQVEYLDRVIDDSPRTAHAELQFLRTMLRDGLEEVRSFIAELRPPVVDVGLAQAIRDAGASFASRHGIAVEVAVNGIDERLTPDEKASVLRIVQEALQNVRKHAAASQVRITFEDGCLVIGDNGRGFDVMRLASGASRNFGLQFMRERAELMGSTLQIESRQGEGTRVLLRLPRR
ncbi:MAG TPA: sensor histidine kinase [candidate division Zixibacteria bacterium]|nr:sensor histidine kinase [candidate division Zixibacteria bacterium]